MDDLAAQEDAPPGREDMIVRNAPGLVDRESTQYKKIEVAFMTGLNSAEKLNSFNEQLNELATANYDTTSETVKRRQKRVGNCWAICVHHLDKTICEDDLYSPEVVEKYLLFFLPAMLKITKPRKGHSVIKSATLQQHFQVMVQLVIANSHFPDGKKAGIPILSKNGLYKKFKDQVAGLTFQFRLERNRDEKKYYGRAEVQIIIACILEETENNPQTRATALQSIFRILLTMFATLRPSSMGYTEKKHRDNGCVIMMKDLRVFLLDRMTYSLELTLRHFKGALTSVEADYQKITLTGVMKGHNVLFDPTVWAVSMLYERGDFLKKYASLDELFNEDSAELVLDPAKKDWPLFRVLNAGGRGYAPGPLPATALSVSQTLGDWSEKAGLARATNGALRRDAGNAYAQQLGRHVAQDIMNHEADGYSVFRNHYSRNTNNYLFTNIRLGEIKGSNEDYAGEALESSRKMHAFQECAVECMMRRQSSEWADKKQEKFEVRKENIKRDAVVLELEAETKVQYELFLQCFNSHARRCYSKATLANVTKVLSWGKEIAPKVARRAANVKEHTNQEHLIRLIPGKEEDAAKLAAELKGLYKNLSIRRKQLAKKGDRQEKSDETQSYSTHPITGTYEDRQAAEKSIHEDVPAELIEAVQSYDPKKQNGQDACQFNGDLHAWHKSLTANIIADEYIDEDEADVMPPEVRLVDSMLDKSSSASTSEANIGPAVENEDAFEPDIDEAQETDVLNLPVPDLRAILMRKIMEPIDKEKGILRVTVNNKLFYQCPKPRCNGKNFGYLAAYNKHMAQCHSPWKELELQMTTPSSTLFRCPARDYKDKTARKVFIHMISEDCVKQAEYLPMKAAHDANVEHLHAGKKESPLDAQYVPINPPEVQLLFGMVDEWTLGTASSSATSQVDPYSSRPKWASLEKVSGCDFDIFRTKLYDGDDFVQLFAL